MFYDDLVRSISVDIETLLARKERDGEVSINVQGTGFALTTGWTGTPGEEWFGSGVRWYKNEGATRWTRTLTAEPIRVRDLLGAHLAIRFRNTDDDDDTWGFSLCATASTDEGSAFIVAQTPVCILESSPGGRSTSAFAISPPPAEAHQVTDSINRLCREGRPAEAEALAAQYLRECTDIHIEPAQYGFYMTTIALAFSSSGNHSAAHRTAQAARQSLGQQSHWEYLYRITAQHLEWEQAALDIIESQHWQTAKVPIQLTEDFLRRRDSIIAAIQDHWTTKLEQLRNQDQFGPLRLQNPTVSHTISAMNFNEAGPWNRAAILLEFTWDACDLIKRFNRADEYSNGTIKASSTIYVCAHDKALEIDIAPASISDVKFFPDSPNPLFGLAQLVASFTAIAVAPNVAPEVHVATYALNSAVNDALASVCGPNQEWTLMSLNFTDTECTIGIGLEPPHRAT